MIRRNASGLLAIIFWCIPVLTVSANGFGLASQDGFATARGEAFVATADNASAICYNPAGITQIAGTGLRLGLYNIYLDPTFQPLSTQPNAGQTYTIGKHWNFIPQVFLTHSFKDHPVSVGLGIYAPFGGNMDWPQDTGFRSVAVSGSLRYITINPVVALKVLPMLSVAGGVMVNYGNMSLNQGLLPLAPRGANYFNFNGDGWSVGYNLGLLWQPHPKISFGAMFRSSAKMNFQGNTDFELNPGPYNSPAQRDASAEFTFPLTTVLGISYRPTPKWNIEFDANYTDWSSFGTVTIEQSPPPVSNPLINNVPVNLDWQASWIYEFGVTRFFDNGWHVSAGYAFDQSSVPNQYYTPLAADLDRHFFCVGTGFRGKTFDFDVAYQFGYGPAHTVSGSTSSTAAITASSGETADGTYDFISHAVLLTVGMRF